VPFCRQKKSKLKDDNSDNNDDVEMDAESNNSTDIEDLLPEMYDLCEADDNDDQHHHKTNENDNETVSNGTKRKFNSKVLSLFFIIIKLI
jgi:hypothetical protein